MSKKKKRIFAIIIGIVVIVATTIMMNINLNKGEYQGESVKTEETAGEEMTDMENTEKTETAEEQTDVVFNEEAAVSVWTTANLNLRQEADGNSTIITVISKGTEIKKSTEENGWAFVKEGEYIGYVSAQYLANTKPEEKTEEAIPGQFRDPNQRVVVIDPGHQLRGDSTKEPNGPGSSVMKARVTSGTTGVSTGVAEYILNLEVSLKLKRELENRGYTVYMTRTIHDVNISNKERAEYATSVNADIAVRIHANGSTDASINGAEVYGPSSSNPYVSHLAKASESLGKCILDAYCAATGFRNRGVRTSDTMTGINWSSVPVTILELGYMSNAEEDVKMNDETVQNNMVQGIANGIDRYFGF